mmetsp:Transcript_22087/g.50580  ORF Transcript_22087/g.50580 Transcript_22087/m.50580 type:complete len:264 (+) Transcript_22087:158-949(+)
MRTVGCGWVEFVTSWSFEANERGATIEQWKSLLLKDILPHENVLKATKKLPAQAAPPQLTRRTIKLLGTVDADAARIEAASLFDTSTLLAKATAARARREAAGISDSVEVRQPSVSPPIDNKLVGKWLEVCWPYKNPDGTTQKTWASGKVVRVADGLTDKRSKKARATSCLLARCFGHGRRTPISKSQRARAGLYYTHKSGISMFSTRGGMIHASWLTLAVLMFLSQPLDSLCAIPMRPTKSSTRIGPSMLRLVQIRDFSCFE